MHRCGSGIRRYLLQASGTFFVASSPACVKNGREMSGESEERHMGATVSLYELTIDQPDTGTRPDSGHLQCTVFPCNIILYMCLFYPQRTDIFRPQNYLAYVCCINPKTMYTSKGVHDDITYYCRGRKSV